MTVVSSSQLRFKEMSHETVFMKRGAHEQVSEGNNRTLGSLAKRTC